MSDQYKAFKDGKLKIKGKAIFKADKPKKKKIATAGASNADPDATEHGGWWRISEESDFRGGIDVAIEAGDGSQCYLSALDNGKFTLGPRHFNEPAPHPEEVLSLIKTPDNSSFSIKTGFGRYVGVDTNGQLIATSEAIGSRERFEIVFQDGKSAIQSAASGLFLTWMPDTEGNIFVSSKTAGPEQFINVRTASEKFATPSWIPSEDFQKSAECETSYVKMYQHSRVDLKNRMISYDIKDKSSIRKAKDEGTLHETLLNRRAKLKSDKYC